MFEYDEKEGPEHSFHNCFAVERVHFKYPTWYDCRSNQLHTLRIVTRYNAVFSLLAISIRAFAEH